MKINKIFIASILLYIVVSLAPIFHFNVPGWLKVVAFIGIFIGIFLQIFGGD